MDANSSHFMQCIIHDHECPRKKEGLSAAVPFEPHHLRQSCIVRQATTCSMQTNQNKQQAYFMAMLDMQVATVWNVPSKACHITKVIKRLAVQDGLAHHKVAKSGTQNAALAYRF